MNAGDGGYLPYVRAEDVEAEGFNVFRKILGQCDRTVLYFTYCTVLYCAVLRCTLLPYSILLHD